MSDNLMSTVEPTENIIMPYNSEFPTKHCVRAATFLGCDSATEVIDVNCLSQKSNTFIHYTNVADSRGHLYCIDNAINALYWVKIVTIAKDCQSNNVILMSTDRGVVLKTVRVISPGEPLLMWFNETILAMMNMPFLTPPNIQGQNKYICHVCHSSFEHPNPLKIHLALKCNQLDTNYLWSSLASEFFSVTNPSIPRNHFSPQIPFNFKFELSVPPDFSQKYSPNQNFRKSNKSKRGANLSTSTSSNEASSTSSGCTSPHNSSLEISPVPLGPIPVNSAFRPYITRQKTYVNHPNLMMNHNFYRLPTSLVDIRHELSTPAQIETFVSNLGKSKGGHICVYCGKIYSRKYGLKIHLRTHTGYKPLKCKFCFRPFGDPSNLNKHIRLHANGETPYKCHLCNKVLVRRRDLERHMKSRHRNHVN